MIENLRISASASLLRPDLSRPSVPWTSLAGESPDPPFDEISYTRFGPGAYLKRHNDERHEELKRTKGWSSPTRRSLSWLVYLQEEGWDMERDGGGLRTYQRRAQPEGAVGSSDDGDLQLGWLEATSKDPFDRAVYMDSRIEGIHGRCKLYTREGGGGRTYLTEVFEADPVLFLTR